jgi:hypothetical protein
LILLDGVRGVDLGQDDRVRAVAGGLDQDRQADAAAAARHDDGASGQRVVRDGADRQRAQAGTSIFMSMP